MSLVLVWAIGAYPEFDGVIDVLQQTSLVVGTLGLGLIFFRVH